MEFKAWPGAARHGAVGLGGAWIMWHGAVRCVQVRNGVVR
jgi:hypothetical protein